MTRETKKMREARLEEARDKWVKSLSNSELMRLLNRCWAFQAREEARAQRRQLAQRSKEETK